MAITGDNYILLIDTVTPRSAGHGADYRPVACGTSNNWGGDAEGISLRNKMDGGYDQSTTGYISTNFDMDGQAIGLRMAEKLIKANFQELAELFYNKREFWIMQADADMTIVREIWCRIGSYRETAQMNSLYTFTASFVGIGRPTTLTGDIIKILLATDLTGDEIFQDGDNNLIETKNA